MARKNIPTTDNRLQEAVEEWKSVTELRHEIAMDAYNFQDDDTKAVLTRIQQRLRLGANGFISIRLPGEATYPVKVEQEHLDYNILYIATEILKDLAVFGVQVANYQFPPSLCTQCGAEIVQELPKKRRR